MGHDRAPRNRRMIDRPATTGIDRVQNTMTHRDMTKTGGAAPISAHPIFPLVVATWFAALLGIGSLLLPVILFETIFAATGLAALVPATQAPLGMTARISIGVAAALIGAIAGVLIARRFASAQRHRDAGPARRATGKTPIAARDELGSDSLDAPVVQSDPVADAGPFAPMPPEPTRYGGKRRALTLTDDSGPSEFLESAPLPGRIEPEEDIGPSIDPETLDLDSYADRTADTENDPGDPPETVRPTPAEPAIASATAAPIADRSLAEMGVVELVERFAIALRNAEPSAFNAGVEADEEINTEPMVFRRSRHSEAPAPDEFSAAPDATPTPSPSARNPLPMALRMPDIDEEEDDCDADDETLGAFSLSFKSGHKPASKANCTSGDESDFDYSSLLSMRNAIGRSHEFVRVEDAEDTSDSAPAETGAMPEPVVVFPGQDASASRMTGRVGDTHAPEPSHKTTPDIPAAISPPHARPFDAPNTPRPAPGAASGQRMGVPNDTEKALREALEKLQRMSGAA